MGVELTENMTSLIGQNTVKLLAHIKSLNPKVNLIAVSKTKPISNIIEAYEVGQRDFGENYIQKLYEKSHSSEILENCPEIKWHMIGPVQSNKAKLLCSVHNLYAVHTVSSQKLLNKIQNQTKNK